MLSAALLLFCAAGLVGTKPLWAIVQRRPSRMTWTLLHGGLALTGLALLIGFAITSAEPAPMISVLLLGLTAAGGLLMMVLHKFGAPIPAGMAFIHPLVAITGVVLLVMHLFGVRVE